MARPKGSRNRGYFFWNARRLWCALIPKTSKRIVLTDTEGNRLTDPTDTEGALRAFCRAMADGRLSPPEEPQEPAGSTLTTILDSYVKTLTEARGRKVRWTLGKFLSGYSTPDQITTQDVRDHQAQQVGKAFSTSLRAMFRHAVQTGKLPTGFEIPVPPDCKCKPPVKTLDSKHLFTEAEIERIKRESSPEFSIYFAACLRLPARPGEIAQITPATLRRDGSRMTAVVQEWKNSTKTKRPRVIAIPSDMVPVLEQLASQCETLTEPLYKTSTGLPWCKDRSSGESGRWVPIVKTLREQGIFPATASLYSCRHYSITRTIRTSRLTYDQIGTLYGTSGREIRQHYGLLRADDLHDFLSQIPA